MPLLALCQVLFPISRWTFFQVRQPEGEMTWRRLWLTIQRQMFTSSFHRMIEDAHECRREPTRNVQPKGSNFVIQILVIPKTAISCKAEGEALQGFQSPYQRCESVEIMGDDGGVPGLRVLVERTFEVDDGGDIEGDV